MTKATTQKKYSCIFFDLDHTLWDYEANSNETLRDLYQQHHLQLKGVDDCEKFTNEFQTVNIELWDLYDKGAITSDVIRNERFKRVLSAFDLRDEKLSSDLSHNYLALCPTKGHLMPYALDVVKYLSMHYRLSVITNGFDEIQHIKMKSTNLLPYFDHVVTSQQAGCRKPSCDIFKFALNCNDIKHHEAIMIGDNLFADIGGACNAYIDAVFFNPLKHTHDGHSAYEIHCLSELRSIL